MSGRYKWFVIFASSVFMFISYLTFAPAGAAQKEELGPVGPSLGATARVVRSVTVETSGAVTGTFRGSLKDEKTGLMGTCNPDTFANFMIKLGGGNQFDEVWVTIWSKGKVGSGEMGTFKLSELDLTFRKGASTDFIQQDFEGPGTLTLTVHNATRGKRRMTGTIEGKGLVGHEISIFGKSVLGKTLNAKVSFDMDFSCGVK